MNMFRFIRCLKNDVQVCSMLDKMVFDTLLSIATQVTNLYQITDIIQRGLSRTQSHDKRKTETDWINDQKQGHGHEVIVHDNGLVNANNEVFGNGNCYCQIFHCLCL